MLQRIPQAIVVAARAFRESLAPQVTPYSRPAWDNGTNYDVPTFLRRSARLIAVSN